MKIDLNEREVEILQTALKGIVDQSAGFTEQLLDQTGVSNGDMKITLGNILKKLEA